METKILRVVAQSEVMRVPSKKKEGEEVAKSIIRLRELNSFGDEFLATLWGNDALCQFERGKLVAVSLWFNTHESNGAYYQDIVVNGIEKIN